MFLKADIEIETRIHTEYNLIQFFLYSRLSFNIMLVRLNFSNNYWNYNNIHNEREHSYKLKFTSFVSEF